MLDFKKLNKKNISLIGPMGSGKSIIGKELAKIYNLNFYDSDIEIEKETGQKINEIFDKDGENQFRAIEEKICNNLLTKENSVISLGGGSIVTRSIRDLIKKYSYCIYLKVDFDILVNRLKSSKKRPLLNNVNKSQKIRELIFERSKFYERADLIIENNIGKKDIINNIKIKLNE